MQALTARHYDVLLTAIVLPLLATFIMGVMESLVESVGFLVRLVRTGWDLCILAAGAGAGIFATPDAVNRWGIYGVLWAILSFAVSILCAGIIMHIRKTKREHVKWWHAATSLALGGGAVALPIYFIVKL